jgi:hypothetical protein
VGVDGWGERMGGEVEDFRGIGLFVVWISFIEYYILFSIFLLFFLYF